MCVWGGGASGVGFKLGDWPPDQSLQTLKRLIPPMLIIQMNGRAAGCKGREGGLWGFLIEKGLHGDPAGKSPYTTGSYVVFHLPT